MRKKLRGKVLPKKRMMTYRQLYGKARETLKCAGIEAFAAESAMLFEKVCGLDRSMLIVNGNTECPQEKETELENLCIQRINGRPLQYILGEWPFLGGIFKVGEGVLIPRDDTEVLVNACVKFLETKENSRVIDLCSGSGIIAVSLKLYFPQSEVFALEKSDAAFGYLKRNVELNNAGINPLKGDVFTDWTGFEDEYFDLIASNPPYISTDELDFLQSEVLCEPREALDGGKDGCDFYRIIISNWSCKLKRGGMLAFEIGEGQMGTVSGLMTAAGFEKIAAFEDLGGTLRTVTGIKM